MSVEGSSVQGVKDDIMEFMLSVFLVKIP